MSILLHPTTGVNPHLTYCTRCGGDVNMLMLLGNQNHVYKCRYCRKIGFGSPSGYPKDECPDGYSTSAGGFKHHDWEFQRELEDHEKLPGGLCDTCIAEIEEHKKIVAAGGIYWRCLKCKKEGVIRAGNEFVVSVRRAHKLDEPDTDGVYKPCGVEFTENDPCPVCAGEIPAPGEGAADGR
jgi:hypothetical protein